MPYTDHRGRQAPKSGYYAGNLPVGSLVTWDPGVIETVELVEQMESRTVVQFDTGREEDIAASTIVWFDDPYPLEEDDEDAPEPWTWHEASLTLRELHDDLYGEPHASEMDLPQVHIQQPGTEGY